MEENATYFYTDSDGGEGGPFDEQTMQLLYVEGTFHEGTQVRIVSGAEHLEETWTIGALRRERSTYLPFARLQNAWEMERRLVDERTCQATKTLVEVSTACNISKQSIDKFARKADKLLAQLQKEQKSEVEEEDVEESEVEQICKNSVEKENEVQAVPSTVTKVTKVPALIPLFDVDPSLKDEPQLDLAARTEMKLLRHIYGSEIHKDKAASALRPFVRDRTCKLCKGADFESSFERFLVHITSPPHLLKFGTAGGFATQDCFEFYVNLLKPYASMTLSTLQTFQQRSNESEKTIQLVRAKLPVVLRLPLFEADQWDTSETVSLDLFEQLREQFKAASGKLVFTAGDIYLKWPACPVCNVLMADFRTQNQHVFSPQHLLRFTSAGGRLTQQGLQFYKNVYEALLNKEQREEATREENREESPVRSDNNETSTQFYVPLVEMDPNDTSPSLTPEETLTESRRLLQMYNQNVDRAALINFKVIVKWTECPLCSTKIRTFSVFFMHVLGKKHISQFLAQGGKITQNSIKYYSDLLESAPKENLDEASGSIIEDSDGAAENSAASQNDTVSPMNGYTTQPAVIDESPALKGPTNAAYFLYVPLVEVDINDASDSLTLDEAVKQCRSVMGIYTMGVERSVHIKINSILKWTHCPQCATSLQSSNVFIMHVLGHKHITKFLEQGGKVTKKSVEFYCNLLESASNGANMSQEVLETSEGMPGKSEDGLLFPGGLDRESVPLMEESKGKQCRAVTQQWYDVREILKAENLSFYRLTSFYSAWQKFSECPHCKEVLTKHDIPNIGKFLWHIHDPKHIAMLKKKGFPFSKDDFHFWWILCSQFQKGEEVSTRTPITSISTTYSKAPAKYSSNGNSSRSFEDLNLDSVPLMEQSDGVICNGYPSELREVRKLLGCKLVHFSRLASIYSAWTKYTICPHCEEALTKDGLENMGSFLWHILSEKHIDNMRKKGVNITKGDFEFWWIICSQSTRDHAAVTTSNLTNVSTRGEFDHVVVRPGDAGIVVRPPMTYDTVLQATAWSAYTFYDTHPREVFPKVLILGPSAQFIAALDQGYDRMLKIKDLQVVYSVGSDDNAEELLQSKCHIIAATSNRTNSLSARGMINLTALELCIIPDVPWLNNTFVISDGHQAAINRLSPSTKVLFVAAEFTSYILPSMPSFNNKELLVAGFPSDVVAFAATRQLSRVRDKNEALRQLIEWCNYRLAQSQPVIVYVTNRMAAFQVKSALGKALPFTKINCIAAGVTMTIGEHESQTILISVKSLYIDRPHAVAHFNVTIWGWAWMFAARVHFPFVKKAVLFLQEDNEQDMGDFRLLDAELEEFDWIRNPSKSKRWFDIELRPPPQPSSPPRVEHPHCQQPTSTALSDSLENSRRELEKDRLRSLALSKQAKEKKPCSIS